MSPIQVYTSSCALSPKCFLLKTDSVNTAPICHINYISNFSPKYFLCVYFIGIHLGRVQNLFLAFIYSGIPSGGDSGYWVLGIKSGLTMYMASAQPPLLSILLPALGIFNQTKLYFLSIFSLVSNFNLMFPLSL